MASAQEASAVLERAPLAPDTDADIDHGFPHFDVTGLKFHS